MSVKISALPALSESIASGDLVPVVNVSAGGGGETEKATISQILSLAGTVTSVGITVPSILSVSGSPITSSGTLAVTLATQNANKVLAGPTSGADAAPTFRAVIEADQSLSDLTTNDVTTSRHGYVPKAPNDVYQFLRGDGTWATLGGPAPTGTPTLSLTPADSAIAVTITKATGSTNTYVYRRTSTGVNNTNGTLVYSGGGTSFTDTGLTNNTTYYYIAYGWNNGAIGPASAEANATPTADLLYDTFTDTNGTSLTSHTPETRPGSNAWAVYNGAMQIQSNTAQANGVTTSNSYSIVSIIDAGYGDVTITLVGTLPSSGVSTLSIWARGTDHTSGYQLQADQVGQTLSLVKNNSGATSLASTGVTLASGGTYTLKMVLSGSSITCYLDGSLKFGGAVTDSTFSNARTKHGVGVYRSTTSTGPTDYGGISKFDTITITSP